MSLFSLGNIRVPHRKNTKDMKARRVLPPKTVELLMSQHIGAPAEVVVKPGDKVFVGTLVGEAKAFVSAPVYSSVSGTVKKIDNYLLPNGKTVPSVIIESDGEMALDPAIKPPVITNYEELSAAARAAGLVGLGGAGFPTSVKLDPGKANQIDTLLINGAECEPYITSDTRTMLDESDFVKKGVKAVLDFSGVKSCVIGIENNKPECIAHLKEVFADDERVKVASLKTQYPQGGEKVLIYNTLGRVVPEGKLPADVGVIVMNVTTVATLAKYIETGMPLVEKCVTVDGSAIDNPENLIAPIGTSISYLLEAVGADTEKIGKVMFGGPMMGVAAYTLEAPIMKNTNAIVALNKKDSKIPSPTPCIHCGRCVAACPMSLNPTAYAKAMSFTNDADRAEILEKEKVNICMECGCCSYVCPAKRPLVENNKLAKAALRDFNAKKKNG